jgi:hypothetical protein
MAVRYVNRSIYGGKFILEQRKLAKKKKEKMLPSIKLQMAKLYTSYAVDIVNSKKR